VATDLGYLAYQAFGTEPDILFITGGLSNIDAVWDEPSSVRLFEQPRGDRVLSTVLFTDIVSSTDLASSGDERWLDLLAEHDRLTRAPSCSGSTAARSP
jgi:class 3 adenylate cyclase